MSMKFQISNFKCQISNKVAKSYWKLANWKLEIPRFSEDGFTLIELLIVFSIMTILLSVGVASFVAYSRSQSVDTTMKDFKQALFTARSRALSQLRDTACFANGFNGTNYEL